MRLIEADKLTALFKFLCEQKNVGTITIEAVEAIIDTAPTVNQWIPCSERLPEESGCYLVSVKNDHERRYSKTAWFEKGTWLARQDVIAWMPLPEPYKGVTE